MFPLVLSDHFDKPSSAGLLGRHLGQLRKKANDCSLAACGHHDSATGDGDKSTITMPQAIQHRSHGNPSSLDINCPQNSRQPVGLKPEEGPEESVTVAGLE